MLSQTLWPLMHHMSRDKALVEEWILGVSGHDGRESVSNAFESYLTKLTNLLLTKKGLFSGRWYFKLFNLIIFLGGLAMACMGKYFISIMLVIQHILKFVVRHVGRGRIYQGSIRNVWICYFIWM
jgi:hypothetical protein